MLKPERICSLFPVRRSTRIKSVSSARALWLAKERAAPPLACRKYKVIPSAEICGEKAYPSEEIWRSPFASCIHTVPCALPTEVISDLPSGAIAIPSSSVGPEVIRWATPFGYRTRQMWKPTLPASDVRQIHFPSGDQAADVQSPSGPIG